MTKKNDQEEALKVVPRRKMLGKLVWVAPAIVATATVKARAEDVSGGSGGGSGGGFCGP